MQARLKSILFLTVVLFLHSSLAGQEKETNPVTKNASPEARALLKFFYGISGQYMLTGQHNFPNVKDRNTQFAAKYIGKTPVVFSTD